MSKILANHPRLSKFVFGLFGAAGMIWLNKAFQGDELFQLITSLLALDTFVNFFSDKFFFSSSAEGLLAICSHLTLIVLTLRD
ncbi:hypothetical protein ACVWB4_07905 [Escherichia coli]